MRFAGVFVGVDRQLDRSVDALTYAGRDAEAMWAAFADANEAEGEGEEADTALVIGSNATRASIADALTGLVRRTRSCHYDVVVIHCSCHGTEDGSLIVHDTSVDDLAGTALPIASITSALNEIAAGAVVVVFESCFSGLAAGCTPGGDDSSLQSVMRALAGEGNRAVVWAAGPSQRAWETPRLKHGVFTHALVVEGLYGTYVERDGRISIRRWLDHGIESAERHAAVDHQVQQPGSIIRINSTPTMPKFRPGPRRQRMLLEERIAPVAADLSGLEMYGFGPSMIDAVRRRINSKPLTDLQRRAICPEGVLAGRGLVVAGPTSCGKTLIGELAALSAARQHLKTAVLLPMRALAAEKWREFEEAFGSEDVQTVRSFGGTNDDDHLIAKGHFDVGFFTYEKFWLLALTTPKFLDRLGTVVIDEVHMLGDEGRGHTVELILTLLRRRREQGKPVQILALSAALGDMRGLPNWLDARLVQEESRPIPLHEGVVGPQGLNRRRDSGSGEVTQVRVLVAPVSIGVRGSDSTGARARGQVTAAVVKALVAGGEQVLIFRSARWSTRELALGLAQTFDIPPAQQALVHLGVDREGTDHSRASQELHKCLRRGVAFHISDLEHAEREGVEQAFRTGAIRILVATSGLAMGVNLPATTVVIADHARGKRRFTVSEYKNMAGRAGRWMEGITHGTSYLVAEREADLAELWTAFVEGQPEPLESRLAGLPTEDLLLVLLCLASVPVTTFELLLLACATFAGFQHSEDAAWRAELDRLLAKAVVQLEVQGFISHANDNIELTDMGRVCGREGLRVASACRVREAANAILVTGEQINDIALISLAQVTDELDAVQTPHEDLTTPAGRTEFDGWCEQSQLTLGRQPIMLEALRTTAADETQYLKRLKRLNIISMWVRGRALTEIEDTFSKHTAAWKGDEPMAGAVRQAAERTADVLRAVARVVAIGHPTLEKELREMVVGLGPRLEHGVGREATALMSLGLSIRRGEAFGLIGVGVGTPEALRQALDSDDPKLYAIFGSEGVYRMRATMRGRHIRGRPEEVVRARLASRRSLFDAIGDATTL